jgi:hypothetical protein
VLLHSGVFLERQYCQFAAPSTARRVPTSSGPLSTAGWRPRSRSGNSTEAGCSTSATSHYERRSANPTAASESRRLRAG